MPRPKNAQNKKLSKQRLYELSAETVELAMIEFIHKIKFESLTEEQKSKLNTLYSNFLRIQESKWNWNEEKCQIMKELNTELF